MSLCYLMERLIVNPLRTDPVNEPIIIPMIKKVHAAYGPERLMWASDSPYQIVPPHTYRDSIALIRNRLDFLSDSDREWLLYKTAEKVYFSQAIPG